VNPASAGFFPFRAGGVVLHRPHLVGLAGPVARSPWESMMSVNADEQELAKFGELAHRWWDADGEFRPLHEINPLRLDWIDAQAAIAGKRVLDVGCGGGILAESMARRGASVLGIDLSTKPLKVAKLHAMEAGVKDLSYREVAVEALAAEAPASFDVVTCLEMLEHVPDPASVVRACATLV
jgi:2-polyprenyl-6-hydroxyphenyl methylase/3-demethylubiquinone-9 3-methyltransferase